MSSFSVWLGLCLAATALSLSTLAAPTLPARDWLIDPTPFKARIVVNPDGKQIELNNGLIRRIIRLDPNAATVALDQLSTGESLLRGVKPEAIVEIDGRRFDVGGLKGQPNYAFLRPEWISALHADPDAFQFTGYSIGQPLERLAWKRTRHHAPDLAWPPKGVTLRLDFIAPASSVSDQNSSSTGRPLVFDDPFLVLDPSWEIHTSSRHPRVSFRNEGKLGEIYALNGSSCFAERALKSPVSVIEMVISLGTDGDTSWGPSLALLFGSHSIKVNLRPGDRGTHGHFELRNNGAESLTSLQQFAAADGGLDTARTYRLRARISPTSILWDVADEALLPLQFHRLFEVAHKGSLPTTLRVGKLDPQGQGSDDSFTANSSTWGRSRISRVLAYGPFDPSLVARTPTPLNGDIHVSVHYELYDGLPCFSKWITVDNLTSKSVTLNGFSSEVLAVVERTSEVDELSDGRTPPNIHVDTDMSFGGMMSSAANRRSFRWLPDPEFHSQVNYEKKTPCLLDVGPDLGPAQTLLPGGKFESYRAWILPFDSSDRERCGLAVRRLYRLNAPWTTENPLMMHLVSSQGQSVTNAIDQCVATGFEMLILSFGSGFDMENEKPATLEKAQAFSSYARSRGIEIGSYSLLSSRHVGGGNDVIMPPGLKPTFGHAPCLQSRWGTNYFRRLYEFHRHSGFTLLEHDGSYPGDPCAATHHPGHHGLADSRWNQWREINNFYRWCRAEGFYLNVPDHYFLSGSTKTAMGYREVNWSLPREQQIIHTRQNIFDGTWQKLPSMGWMFVPLTEYQGGGAAATIEPLSEHLSHYSAMLESNLALGVQACYRGPRLYDTEITRAEVKSKVEWFKAHRDILESDLIHGRRADARDLDWMLHVNPHLKSKGLLAVFNPLDHPVSRTLRVNLYYTGLQNSTLVRERDSRGHRLKLGRDHSIELPVTVSAQSMNWFVFE